MGPLIKKVLIILTSISAVSGLFIAGLFIKQEWDRRAEEALVQQQIQEVENHTDKSYGNKRIFGVHVSNQTAEVIAEKLQAELAEFKQRKVMLTVNGKNHEYSMKKLKETFFYLSSDGKQYKPGQELELAQYIVGLDKELPQDEQYQILSGEKPATEYVVEMKAKYNKKQVSKVLKKLAKKYEIPVTNSHIKKSGKITKTAKGRALDVKSIQPELAKYLKNTDKIDFAASYETHVVKPTWFPKDLKKVKNVISSFSTTFVSTTSRGHNIKVGASRINGICLLPGEKASFDKIIHDGSDGQYFMEAGSYLNGETVQTKGGGICQISSTAYNALLRAGILPSKRYPHSMSVSYVPLGLDAAISENVKDLEVTNTLDVPIVIKMFTKGNVLTTQIISYKNALKGKTYIPRSVILSSTSAKAYLDTYKKGRKISSMLLHTDRYMSH